MSEPSAKEHTLSLPKRPLTLLPLAGLLTAPGAEGAVVFTRNPLTVSLSLSTSVGGDTESLAWDIDGNSIPDARITINNERSSTLFGIFQAGADMGLRGLDGKVNATVQPVGLTDMVGSSNRFMTGRSHLFNLSGSGDFFNLNLRGGGPSDYVGFRFERSGNTHYGVAEVSFGRDPADTLFFTIHQWAWESDPGVAISGAVLIPEPGTPALAVLALGSLVRRRRRSA